MLTALQQKQVWEGMLGAEIRANYFADLSGRYATRQRGATWATLLASSGAAASVLSSLPAEWTWIRPALALLAAGISLYSVVMQNQKFAVDASDLHSRWNRLGNDYERLWDNMYSAEALQRLDELIARESDISKASTAFPNREKLMLKWEDHVISHRSPAAGTA